MRCRNSYLFCFRNIFEIFPLLIFIAYDSDFYRPPRVIQVDQSVGCVCLLFTFMVNEIISAVYIVAVLIW